MISWKRITFLIMLLISLATMLISSSYADCLDKYEKEIAKGHIFNRKTSYKIIHKILSNDYEMVTNELDGIWNKIRKSNRQLDFSLKDIYYVLKLSNDSGLLCKEEKPIKIEQFIENYLYYKDSVALSGLQWAFVEKKAKTPDDILKFIKDIPGSRLTYAQKAQVINIIDSQLETFYQLPTPPKIGQVLQLNQVLEKIKGIDGVRMGRWMALESGPFHSTQDYIQILSQGEALYKDNQSNQFNEIIKNLIFESVFKQINRINNVKDANTLLQFLNKKIKDDANFVHIKRFIKERLDHIKEHLSESAAEYFQRQMKQELQKNYQGQLCEHELGKNKVKFLQLTEDMQEVLNQQRPKDSKACLVCMDDFSPDKLTQCSNPKCQSAFCDTCLKDSLDLKLKEKDFPYACDRCHTEIFLTDDDLARLGHKNDTLAIKHKTLMAYHKALYPKAKNCPTPDCPNRVDFKECQDFHAKCGLCGYGACFGCGDMHKGQNCQEYLKLKQGNDAFAGLLEKGIVRECFNKDCRAYLQKSEGCNRVLCSKCNRNNLWDPNSLVCTEWLGYDKHNAAGETWKGVAH